MSISYQNFLERLKEERISNHLSQNEMGRIVRMSQSHYCKAENGMRRFSYFEMQCLCESELDSYYIFTGKKYKCKYNEFWRECSYEELLFFLNIVCLTIEHFYMNNQRHYLEEIFEDIKYIKSTIVLNKKNGNVFFNIRKMLGYNQQKMAQSIEVDIKKLRELENGKVLPDSEIIWKMYYLYNIPPALLVKSKADIVNTIEDIMNSVDTEKEEILFAYLKQCHQLMLEECT